MTTTDQGARTADAPANGAASRAGKDLRGPGAMLRQAREQRGMTQREAADRLNLACRFVVAMEDETFEKIPAPAFARGYLRAYAKLLALPGDELIRRYEHIVGDDTDPYFRELTNARKSGFAEFVRNNPLLVLGSLSVVVALVVAGLIWWAVSSSAVERVSRTVAELPNLTQGDTADEPNAAAETAADSGSSPAAESPTVSVPAEASSTATAAPDATASSPAEATALTGSAEVVAQPAPNDIAVAPVGDNSLQLPAESTTLPSETVAAIVTDPNNPNEATAANSAERAVESLGVGPDQISFAFSEQCWVEIYDFAGTRLVSDMKGGNADLSVRGQGPFQVTVGNASAVRMQYNGRAVNLRGSTRNNVANLRLGAE